MTLRNKTLHRRLRKLEAAQEPAWEPGEHYVELQIRFLKDVFCFGGFYDLARRWGYTIRFGQEEPRPTHKVRDTWLSHGWRENPAEAGC